MVSHSKIAEYWMRKFINMETAEIISYEEYKQDKRHVNAELIRGMLMQNLLLQI